MKAVRAPWTPKPATQPVDPLAWQHQHHTTSGHYPDEVTSAAAFDAIAPDDVFHIWREVTGTLDWPLHGQTAGTRVRIDRLMMPTEQLLANGWEHGAVGVEIKRSGIKAGAAINQMLDYLRSTFTVDGARVRLGYAVLWPYDGPQGGPLAAIFHGQRLGYAHVHDDTLVISRTTGGHHDLVRSNLLFGTRQINRAVSHKVGSR